MRRLARLLACLALIFALTAAAVTASAVFFALDPPTRTAGVLIVLGGAMTPEHRLGSETAARVEAAVALYEAGAAPRIHFTGGTPGYGLPGAGDEMRAFAVALGVPPAATSAENASRSTLQNALFSRPVLVRLADGTLLLVSDG
jgi:uncharacterized SAM-binding protein YcdF (DUF218 family)